MKRIYILIAAGRLIDDTSLFYRVLVSDAVAGQKQLHFLECFCEEHGYFLAPYSHDVAAFLTRIATSLEKDVSQLQFREIDCKTLLSHLKQYKSLPTYMLTGLQKQMLCQRKSICQLSNHAFSVLQKAVAHKRLKPKV